MLEFLLHSQAHRNYNEYWIVPLLFFDGVMDRHPVRVASFSRVFQADLARAFLESNQVFSIVEDVEVNTTMSHIGSALGGARLVVAAEELDRATQLLEQFEETNRFPHWRCTHCGTEIEGNFQCCWACGQDRTLSPTVEADRQPEPLDSGSSEIEVPNSPVDHEADQEIIEDQARQAWRAAVLAAYPSALILSHLIFFAISIRRLLDLGNNGIDPSAWPAKSKRQFLAAWIMLVFWTICSAIILPLIWSG